MVAEEKSQKRKVSPGIEPGLRESHDSSSESRVLTITLRDRVNRASYTTSLAARRLASTVAGLVYISTNY